jgi:RNA polymerase sigma-70 factor, ECF subfamily
MSETSSLSLTEAKLERLYVKLEKPMYNVIYRWLWNASEVQDILQEAFLRLWKMRDRVDLTTVEPLVFRIAINLASNRRRALKLRKFVGLETIEDQPSNERDPEARQRDLFVRKAIDALPEEQRRVVIMCELSELSYREVGVVLGIPEGTVGSRRNKALRTLKDRLVPMIAEETHVT